MGRTLDLLFTFGFLLLAAYATWLTWARPTVEPWSKRLNSNHPISVGATAAVTGGPR